jgi:CBS domain containing-hemolysin-like protein
VNQHIAEFAMTQLLIAASIVAAALAYSAWVLMPAAWRRAAAARLARRAVRSGLALERVRALQTRLEGAGGCGECAKCKGCASPAPPVR